MSDHDQSVVASPESGSYVSTPESVQKTSIFEKLKDKTKKAGSRIKSKVGKKKNSDGTDAPAVDGEEHEGEGEEITSDDSPSPASPGVSLTTSAPRDQLGSTFQSEPSRYGSDSKGESEAVPDMSGLSLSDHEPAVPREESEPHAGSTEMKASEPDSAMEDGTNATVGELGIANAAKPNEPKSEEISPVTDNFQPSEAITDEGVGGKTEPESGDSAGYHLATDTKNESRSEAADHQQTKSETISGDELPSSTDTTESSAYQANVDVTEPKAMDQTDQEAADQQKGSEIKDLETDQEAADQPKASETKDMESSDRESADERKASETIDDAVEPKAEDLSKDTLDEPSKGPSAVDQVLPTVGDEESASTEAAKDSTGSALDTTKDHAKQTAVDAATPKQEDKALSEKVTDTLSAVPAKVSDAAASVTETARSPTTTTPGTVTQAPAAHSSEHPASPGILGKIGGLFGFGAKAPEDQPHDASH